VMNSGRCLSCIGVSLCPGDAMRFLHGIAACVLSLAMAVPSVWAQGTGATSASAEAPMVNLPSDTWGQSSGIAASEMGRSAATGGTVNVDRQASSGAVASTASRAEATTGSPAAMDPAPDEDIAVAATPPALPVVQRSVAASAGSGSVTATPEASKGQSMTVPATGDTDGPPQ
jgi:hypothetical protein